jgi:hypothetical protein
VAENDQNAKGIGLVIDFIAKIVLGAATLLIAVVTWNSNSKIEELKRRDSAQSQCSQSVSALFDFVYNKKLDSEVINSLVNYRVPSSCEGLKETKERGGLVSALSSVAATASFTPQSSAAATPGSPTPARSPTPANPIGWVAVGFLDSPDFNFTKANGDSMGTSPINTSVIKSKWQVNVRNAPADWQAPLGVLPAFACFRVDGSKTFPAGEKIQLWAIGRQVDCT